MTWRECVYYGLSKSDVFKVNKDQPRNEKELNPSLYHSREIVSCIEHTRNHNFTILKKKKIHVVF